MSNNTYNYEKDPVSGQRSVTINDNLKVVESVITREGLFKGFTYHQPRATTLAGALALFGNDEQALLEGLDRVFSQMAYARAMSRLRSRLPQDQREDETVRQWLERHADEVESLKLSDPILLSVEDAATFKPGERELTPAGIVRALGKAQALAMKLIGEGKISEATEQFAIVASLTEKFSAAMELLKKQAEVVDAEA